MYESEADNALGRTGREAYHEYGKEALPEIIELGGSIVYMGRCDHFFVGHQAQSFDDLIIVR